MEINIKILTPLWTGGVEAGKCDRIHETGILGSLRWWMEVLVRGMGGQVKDPTAEKSEHRSSLDPKKFDAKVYRQLQDEAKRRQYLRDAGLCDVSQIFGATGWKHRFRLEVIQDNTKPDDTVTSTIQAERSNDKKGKPPTWYFPKDLQDKPRSKTFTIQIQSLHPDFKPEIIGGLIQFIADHSALGARPQMGFGVIQVEGGRINTQALCDWLKEVKSERKYPDLPSLHNIFLAKIQHKDSSKSFTEVDTFNLKYDLRQLFRIEENAVQQPSQGNKPILKKNKESSEDKRKQEQELRHFIMGAAPDDKKENKTEDDRIAAKIKISRPYPDDNSKLMRVWGWIPETAKVRSKDGHEKDLYTNGWDREKIVNKIHQHLVKNYTLLDLDWREMESGRDQVTPNESSTQSFLCSLLNAKESSNVSK